MGMLFMLAWYIFLGLLLAAVVITIIGFFNRKP